MNIRAKALVLLAFCGSAAAGDLVLKLGTSGNYRYHRIPVTGSVTVSPATGDITVDPVADAGTSNDGWCPAGGGTGGSAPSFTTPLSANTTSLPAGGGTVQLSWAASGATEGCTSSSSGVSGWNGGAVTSPTNISLTAAGTYSFSVTCSNTYGSTSGGTVSVTVASSTTGGSNPECSSRPAPTGLVRQTSMVNYNLGGTLNQQNSEFQLNSTVDVTGYVPLLGDTFNSPDESARLFLAKGKYAAFGFSTTGVAVGARGSVSWSPVDSGVVFSVQISPCEADFDWVVDGNCKSSSTDSSISWKIGTKPATNPGWYCYLDPNKSYFINVIASQAGQWSTTTCNNSTYCTWLVAIGGIP